MKDCSSTSVVPPSAFRTTVRKESTTTTPGLAFSTSFVISSKTASRSFSNTTWLKLIKRTAVFNLAWSKNVLRQSLETRTDALEIIDFTEDRFKAHGYTALREEPKVWENFRCHQLQCHG